MAMEGVSTMKQPTHPLQKNQQRTAGMINIIGAGLAGLSAALTLAEQGQACRLVSPMPSERAQSVMAEGGINAALDTMGEHDSPEEHFTDTMKGGVELADPNAVWALCREAPATVKKLCQLGAALKMEKDAPVLRSFGGQKKKRTAYAQSSTGKILMTALIDEVRKYEARGLVRRYSHHRFRTLRLEGQRCTGAELVNIRSGEILEAPGAVILAAGGMNSLFPGLTTGTVINTGDVTAEALFCGAELANPEFIQYHPTTVSIPGKRCLISEAARGEGGRLFAYRDGKPWYFMEEKYPELGNLMPRDVVSREMERVRQDGKKTYLDMTGLDASVWKNKLSDLRQECLELLGKDPVTEPIEVSPGIHYFMGGIRVDEQHRTNIRHLYAAGECACQYHGANRLGGNSMLGAVFGGSVAAQTALAEYGGEPAEPERLLGSSPSPRMLPTGVPKQAAEIFRQALGIFRSGEELENAVVRTDLLLQQETDPLQKKRLLLGKAVLLAAQHRKESRGAHTRLDFPERNDLQFRKTTVVRLKGDRIVLSLSDIPPKRGDGR